jgi:transcriptional regulator with XRE-family HTH domain
MAAEDVLTKTNLSKVAILARRAKDMTLRDTEKASGVSNAYVSQIETGSAANITLDIVFALAEAYGVPYQLFVNAAFRDRQALARKEIVR